jgi:hypothetical protein
MTAINKSVIVLPLPDVARSLWLAQQALKNHYEATGLKFTLDGRLVGDIAEALALEHFELSSPGKRTPGVDALTGSGQTVQVKAAGAGKQGPSFSQGKGIADLLLFFQIDFEGGAAAVLYNGPEAPVRSLLPSAWNGTKSVSLARLATLGGGNPRHSAVKLRTTTAALAAQF